LLSYDPSFSNTAACKSKMATSTATRVSCAIRGYPIEELAEKSTYLESRI